MKSQCWMKMKTYTSWLLCYLLFCYPLFSHLISTVGKSRCKKKKSCYYWKIFLCSVFSRYDFQETVPAEGNNVHFSLQSALLACELIGSSCCSTCIFLKRKKKFWHRRSLCCTHHLGHFTAAILCPGDQQSDSGKIFSNLNKKGEIGLSLPGCFWC